MSVKGFVTDPSSENRGFGCTAVLECLLGIIRALRMGSCLSGESRSPHASSPTQSFGIKRRKNSKKKTSRSSSFNSQKEEHLHRIPGRMFLNGSSQAASLFTQQGKKGTNQDAMIVWENFGSRTDTVFCGVFDGHGPFGHMVAKRVRDSLPLKLSAHWEVNVKGSNDVLREGTFNEETPLTAAEDSRVFTDHEINKNPEKLQAFKDTFLKAFKVMDRELRMYANIDCFCSGTTAVTLIKQGQDLIIGNVGDSRAILCTRDKTNSLVAVQLTVDLKPNLPAEAERIRKCKGRVFALQDEPEVTRVWLPNNDSPGLAMARAFGDFCLKDFGLISVPDIFYRRLTENDQFIVLASDGIWDVLTNREVVDIVASAESRSCAARAVVEAAVRSWKYRYPTSKVDDCAVVCLFLSPHSNTVSTASAADVAAKKEPVALKPKPSDQALATAAEGTDADEEFMDDELAGTLDEDHSTVDNDGGIDWSALEGVARVNTLLTLPRFVPEEAGKQEPGNKKTN